MPKTKISAPVNKAPFILYTQYSVEWINKMNGKKFKVKMKYFEFSTR